MIPHPNVVRIHLHIISLLDRAGCLEIDSLRIDMLAVQAEEHQARFHTPRRRRRIDNLMGRAARMDDSMIVRHLSLQIDDCYPVRGPENSTIPSIYDK